MGRLVGLGALFLLSTGCVERRMTIMSDPPGAAVNVNGFDIGATPVDVPSHVFIDYGHYDIRLFKDGYEPLLVRQAVPPPWYERFPFDFFAENVIPWHIKDNRFAGKDAFVYQLTPNRVVPPEELLENAEFQRSQGRAIVSPVEPPPIVPR